MVGVDVGGTFTDAVMRHGGRLHVAKVPTTPDDHSRGVMDAIAAVQRVAGAPQAVVGRLAHGTTVATNAMLEGTGAATAFVITAGFGDLLELGRQQRAHLYRLDQHHPPPIVPRTHVVEVDERCGPDGVVRPLREASVAAVVEAVGALGVDTVAVCLLFGHLYPAHEQRIVDALRAADPTRHVSASHQVLPAIREYERAATTCVDAALNPVMRHYLSALSRRTRDAGLPDVQVMQSSGGLTDAATAAHHAARTVLSGPAAGVMAVPAVAPDVARAISFDMGGTSCDVALVEDGVPGRTHSSAVAGRPLHLPMLDVVTVSAGGGSIAWADSGGALRVGPHSAGARPGPAAYGRGGQQPTVTDANVVLGRLGSRDLSGGVTLDTAAARHAVGALAATLGMTLDACAAGIVRVANTEMARAVRQVSVERGVDPRGATLVAFGGAGPLHACEVADEVGATRVQVPVAAGALAALGLLVAGERRERMQALTGTVDPTGRRVSDAAVQQGGSMGDAPHDATVTVHASCRYQGQRHELEVAWPPQQGDRALVDAFHEAHRRRFGHARSDRPVEVAGIAVAHVRPGVTLPPPDGREFTEIAGPATHAGDSSTLWLPPGWRGHIDADGGVIAWREVPPSTP